MATCEVMFTIFLKDILDLRERVPGEPEPQDDDDDDYDDGDDPSKGDKIDVINPTTGLQES